MVTLLSKLLIHNFNDYKNSAVRRSYGVLCGAVGIFLNLVLFFGKFIVGQLSGSIAIVADAFNNLSDAGSSIISLIGFRLSGQQADPEHPFGHGRMEYISGLMVSIAILIMGFELGKTSIEKIFQPESVEFSPVSVIILAAAILVKFYMMFYNFRIAKKIDSVAMKATAKDSLSDVLATSVVLITTLLSAVTDLSIDGYCGIIVTCFILYSGFSALKDTIGPLLGEPPTPEFVKEIESIVLSHTEITGVHDLLVHNYGPGRLFISLHAEVPADGDLVLIHDTVDNVEHDLASYTGGIAVIHMDPVVTNDERINSIKEKIRSIAREIDTSITLHDFRIVDGPTHTNVIFDVVVPYKFHLSDEEVKRELSERIQQLDNRFFAVIDVDKNYTGR